MLLNDWLTLKSELNTIYCTVNKKPGSMSGDVHTFRQMHGWMMDG